MRPLGRHFLLLPRPIVTERYPDWLPVHPLNENEIRNLTPRVEKPSTTGSFPPIPLCGWGTLTQRYACATVGRSVGVTKYISLYSNRPTKGRNNQCGRLSIGHSDLVSPFTRKIRMRFQLTHAGNNPYTNSSSWFQPSREGRTQAIAI